MNFLENIASSFDQKSKKIEFSGLQNSSIAYLIAQLFPVLKRPFLVVLPTSHEAESFFSDLQFFIGKSDSLHFFPNLDVLPYFQLSPHPDILATRLGVLYQVLSARTPLILVTSYSAAQRVLPPKSVFNDYADYLVAKEEVNRESLLRKLVEAGYLSSPLVEDRGTYSVRGGILDVFPPHSTHPYRIEFFGDQIDSIRLFEPSTQKSLHETNDLILLPSKEVVLNETTVSRALPKIRDRFDELGISKSEREIVLNALKHSLPFAGLETFLPLFYESTSTLFDYFNSETVLWQVDSESAFEHAKKLQDELNASHEKSTSPERIIRPNEILISKQDLEKKIDLFQTAEINPFIVSEKTCSFKTETNELLTTKILPPSAGIKMLEPLIEFLKEQIESGLKILLVASTETQKIRLVDLFSRHELFLKELPSSVSQFLRDFSNPLGEIFITVGELSQGFRILEDRFLFILDEEIFGKKVRAIRKSKNPSEVFTSFEDLKEGDYIVHSEHGVGIYQGLKSLELGGVKGEFLVLEYLGKDKLYLPVYRLSLIQRYSTEQGSVPQLDKLGGTGWLKNQEKVKKSIRAIAGELLKIYAARATQQKEPLTEGGELFEEFEAAFPYTETIDQEKAIEEVIRDLESDKPMDRLICGDVGYGKTEIALRATFKTVLNNRQVAILVPTTILAFQHYETFLKRLQSYGVKVEMLCRFRDAKEQKEIVKQLSAGQIDVIVGTHRLLQPDLKMKNLGLLVIDEEHRFGVTHKEKIKKLKNMVDVLTLTATPIPRTLNLSLFGIRDLSMINTPPADREAIRTFVAHFDESLIREAVLRELQRGGQIFFVHNRVQTIHSMKERLQKIIPEAKIVVAHGQMNEEELEEAMIQFLHKEANLLLCTSIIESGLDFPSANTIIINRSDGFGLAQLYQLRGRVGRSNVRAYCYLLTPAEVAITADARSRLAILQRFTELGSGFKIAAHDLEIRGAGNILGAEQHGHISAVGYEMYMRLLEQTIGEIRGEEKPMEVEPELNFMIPAVLPEDYVSDPQIRLGLYKRISNAPDEEILLELSRELEDRFGKSPSAAHHLILLMKIRLVAKRLLIESIHQEKTRMIYKFHAKTAVPPDSLLQRMKKEPKHYQLTPDLKWITPQRETSDEKILEAVYRFLISLEGEIVQG